MVARGVSVQFDDGFTLPDNIGELGDDITELDLSNRSLTGEDDDQIVSSTTSHTIFQKHRCLAARAYPDEGAGLQCVAQQQHRLHVAG